MGNVLRVVLIIVSLVTVVYVVHKIKRSKLQIEYSLFWIIVSGLILVLSIFPKLAYWISGVLGFMSPVNFIFLFMIFILLVHSFYLTNKCSQLENMIQDLTQEIAVRKTVEEDTVLEVTAAEEKDGKAIS